MPTENPRINVTLPHDTHAAIAYFAEIRGISLSEAMRDLVEDALELQEELYLAKILPKRLADKRASISHENAWS